jgi:hypothetical protein
MGQCCGVNFGGGPIPKRLVFALVVVKSHPRTNPNPGFDNGGISLGEGEWRGALQPRALSEPDVNLSIHPAPIIQPLVQGSSGRTWPGCAA